MKQPMNHHHDHAHDHHDHDGHNHSLKDELLCHVPYAAFSLALGFIVLSVMHFIGMSFSNPKELSKGYHILFHSFHYLHIVYAVMGTLLTYSRFSSNLLRGVVLSIVSPLFFCTLSDIALPTLAGELLGVHMHIHICLISEMHNIIPLMLIGLLTGLAMRARHQSSLGFISLGSHFIHIFISALASLFYMVAYGFNTWYHSMGILFFFLIIAVVIPCTISDVVVPVAFARWKKKKA